MPPFASFSVAALLVIAILGGGCREQPTTVLEPVVRLTKESRRLRQTNVPERCRVGDEFRPSFGCPPFIFMSATLDKGKKSWRRVRLVAQPPEHLQGKKILTIPTLTLGPNATPIYLPLTVLPKVQRTLALNLPFDAHQLTEKSRAQIRAHVLEPTQRKFATNAVAIPSNAELRVGLAVSEFAEQSGAGATEFLLEAEWDGGARELLRETLPPSAGGAWHDRRINLADLAGRQVSFRFTTSAGGNEGLPHSSTAFPLWGNPEILTPKPRDGRRNVILISLDTVRADYLGGKTVRGAQVAPWFDKLSTEGSRFTQAVSTFSSTSASHMSLFTGHYPATHNVRFATHQLADRITTLPQVLARAGYSTGAVTENAMILSSSGFSRGFDSYRENRGSLKVTGSIDRTFADGIQWVEGHQDDLFFLFLHTYEAHSPYAPKPEALAAIPEVDPEGLSEEDVRWEKTRRAYAAEIHYTDGALERLFSELKRLDLLGETLIVITADHGDEFGEHGRLGHAKTVYDEVLRVPLLFWDPDRIPQGRVVDELVSLVDVAPTILELVDVPLPVGIPGRSLVSAMRGDPLAGDGVRFAEGLNEKIRWVTARTATHKWIWSDDGQELRAYDLRTDPGEQSPIDDPELITQGHTFVEAYLAQDDRPEKSTSQRSNDEPDETPERVLDETTRRKLEALGYVE